MTRFTIVAQSFRFLNILPTNRKTLQIFKRAPVLPEGAQSQAKLDKLKQRMNRCVAQLERFADITLSKDVNLEQIVLACALEYLDFRYTQEWRAYCPKLSNWLSEFSMRTDMQTTRPPQA